MTITMPVSVPTEITIPDDAKARAEAKGRNETPYVGKDFENHRPAED